MLHHFLERLARLVTKPDGTSRFSRVNVALIVAIAFVAGIVPAFALGDEPTPDTTSTSTTAAAPIVVGPPTTTAPASELDNPEPGAVDPAPTTTTVAAPTTTTTAPATTTTTAPAEEFVEGDLPPGDDLNGFSTPSDIAPNPGWPTECAANIALLLDRSSSIGDPQYGGNFQNTVAVKDAAYSFIRAVGGTNNGPRMYINAFATTPKPVYQLWGGGFADVPATRNPFTGGSVDDAIWKVGFTPFASPPLSGYGDYGTPSASVGRGRTNWQGAMAAVPAGADLMIIVTDGEPTWWNGANPATNNGATQPDDVIAAIGQANAIKRAGTRVVAVHVGQERGPWATNLAAISGPVQNSDYYITSYAGLDETLAGIANASKCRAAPSNPGLTITKTADRASAAPGDTVTYSFTVANSGDVALAPVTVTDNVLGPIGTVASLEIGASQTLTKTYVVPAGSGPITNVATATGTTPDGGTVTAQATHTLQRLGITLVKTASKTNPVVGETVVYTYVVTNTSGVTLSNLALTDDKLGAVTLPVSSLAPGATTTGSATYTTVAGDADTSITNVATVTGTSPEDATVEATATATINVRTAGISIVKTATKDYAQPGSSVTYSFAVTNVGTASLTNVAVTDDKLGPIGTIGTLAAGATSTLTKDFTVPAGAAAITNVATATGTAPDGSTVTDTDTHTLTPTAITVVKTANTTTPVVGDVVTYTYLVTNTGGATMTNVTLADDKLGAVTLPVTTLAAGASTTGTAQYTTVAGDANTSITNVATVTGTAPDSSTVTDTDTETIQVQAPGLTIVKTASKEFATPGSSVTYSFAITNSGTTALAPVTVTDDQLGEIGVIATLAPGATQTLTKGFTVPQGSGPIVNVATACAPNPSASVAAAPICATDNHTLERLSIGVVKTASNPSPSIGDTVVYTYIVTNTSQVTLTNVTLTDDKLGNVVIGASTLAPGASTTGTAAYVVQPADGNTTIVNVATANGRAPDGTLVSANATASIAIPAPQGTVVTLPPGQTPGVQVKGTSLAYTGAGTSTLIQLGLVLLALGGGVLVLARRRRPTFTTRRR